MGTAAYNRGTKAIEAQIDREMNGPAARERMMRASILDENADLRDRLARLEREHTRAKRSIEVLRLTLTAERQDRRDEVERLGERVAFFRVWALKADRRWRWCSRVIRAALSPAEYHRVRAEIDEDDR